jgi:hypothetical protein
MPLITGEYVPDGSTSTLGRLLVAKIERGDINLIDSALLTSLQDKAVQGRYGTAMATYIQWLAPRMSELKRDFRKTCTYARDEAKKSPDKFLTASHARFAETYAQLKCATDLYLEYCLDVCAFGKSVADDYAKTIDIGLKSIVRAQGQYQKDSDEVERFIGLLRACFNSGECHVVDYLTKGPPSFSPYTWGWRKLAEKEGYTDSIAGKGDQIGWIRQAKIKKSELGTLKKGDFDEDVEDEGKSELWLIPDAVYKCVQRLANAQQHPLLLSRANLFRSLMEKGILVRVERDIKNDTRRPDARTPAIIPGLKKPRVLAFYCKLILDVSDDGECEIMEASDDGECEIMEASDDNERKAE